jgi:hypothetical protein
VVEELKGRQSVMWGTGASEPLVKITSQPWPDIATGGGAAGSAIGAEVTRVNLHGAGGGARTRRHAASLPVVRGVNAR